METVFWSCLFLIAYPYVVYPAALVLFNRLARRGAHVGDPAFEPEVSVIMPVHNEAQRVEEKVRNLLSLEYPREKLQIIVVGDGCTDDSMERAEAAGVGTVTTVSLRSRQGKAGALNAGLELAKGAVVVFTDAGIILEPLSLRQLVSHFADERIACVSGEDYIEGQDSEGLYGRLELLLRREEARLHSIAGASGCFYAQRRSVCRPFVAGMAPDFLSVLVTVKAGKRAIAEPCARGVMTATSSQSAEFRRKVRTFLRGITALFGNSGLLNPLAFPAFSFVLWSHKLMRWLAPLPMVGCLISSALLRGDPLFGVALLGQLALYVVAICGLLWPKLSRFTLFRLSSFFLLVNAAALQALLLWLAGNRVEVWQPTQRPA